MEFVRREAPYIAPKVDVASMMLHVMVALIPAALAHTWYFGPGFLCNLIIAALFCVGGEALMMRARGRQPMAAISDYSVLVTAVLLAFALPSLTPWWVTATGSLFAVIVAKHLYGGLGFNVFNPAMAGYVVILVAFPMEVNLWVAPRMGDIDYQYLTILQTINYTLTGSLPEALAFDAISRATPLDAMQSGLRTMLTYSEIRTDPIMGNFGGRGWEWIGNLTLAGGIWLLVKKVIRWHIPAGVFAGLLVSASVMYTVDPGANASPGFHLFSGATILCAFFIATDPVSAATSPKGRFVYGVGIGLLIFIIRRWGSYADGVAFAVLLMNMATPAIDYVTRPHIVGHARRGDRE